MAVLRGRNATIAVVGACAVIGLATYIVFSLRKRKNRQTPKAGGLVLASLEELSLYERNQPRRLLASTLVTNINLAGAGISVSTKLGNLPIFHRLEVLDLSRNGIQQFPETILTLELLQRLNLSSNELMSIPAGISSLVRLWDLDLGRNKLERLPNELCQLVSLKTLNVMSNCLTSLPESLGLLTNVFRLGLKSNKLKNLPDSIGEMASLVEIFVTDNQIVSFPASMGKLSKLFKLQASFNALESLPEEMGYLPNIELFRVAVNKITVLPASFQHLDRLAWFSLAGNPACVPPPQPRPGILPIPVESLRIEEKLGDGASGDVYAARWLRNGAEEPEHVVFKQFKAETSPDGHSRDETAITCSLDHPNLTRVLGTVDSPRGMVLERIYARSMADKPNFDSLLRCRWDPAVSFTLSFVLSVARGVASALHYLHKRGICHGDIYAHNILTTPAGHPVLCDFGAAFCYPLGSPMPYEAQEMRAFGLFLRDLERRIKLPHPTPATMTQCREELQVVVTRCIDTPALERPRFSDVLAMLTAL